MSTDEMRRVEPHPVQLVSGFTPINRSQHSSAEVEDTGFITSQNHKSRKGRSRVIGEPEAKQMKRKTLAASTSAASKRPRKTPTSDRFKDRDFSKDYQRKKPGLEGHDSLTRIGTERLVLPDSGIASSKLQTILEDSLREGDEAISCVPTPDYPSVLLMSRHIGLTERYQAACNARIVGEGEDHSESRSFPTSSVTSSKAPVKVVRNEHDEPLRLITQGLRRHSIIHKPSKSQRSPSLRDFEPPPSAQPPSMALEEWSNLDMFKEDRLSLHGSPDGNFDVYSVDDVMLSDVDKLLVSEQGFQHKESEVSDVAIQDDEFADDFDGWPDDVSLPDAVAIYDEELHQISNGSIGPPESADEQFSGALELVSGNTSKASQSHQILYRGPENESDDLDQESSLADVSAPVKIQQPSTPYTSPQLSSSPKLQWLPPKIFTPGKSPWSVPTGHSDVPHLVSRNAAGTYLPFARPSFPKPVLDRSPILGLINTTVLRTCFRIGEALNAAAQASRSNTDGIIELYARISASSREANGGFRQSFQFADLFTDKPPYLSGTSSIWKGVGLWDQDSKVFLGETGRGKLCRAVGRIKRGEGQAGGCGMTVLSIWEVDWEDVGIAKGVVCS